MRSKKYDDLFIATTDTVTGIGGPINRRNRNLIYKLKQRPKSKQIIIMISSLEQARTFKGWTDEAEELAKKVWPGNTTLVISKKIALRIPGVEKLRKLIDKTGPVYMTSANISGEKQLSFAQAVKKFPQISKSFDFNKPSGKPSTIIEVSTGRIIR